MTTIFDAEIEVKPTSQKSDVIAQAEILFHGDLRVKGIRVLKSKYYNPIFQEKITIQPPAYQTRYKQWVEIFFVENKELWVEIEQAIYSKFKELNIIWQPLEDEVSVDDIPANLGSRLPP